MDRTLHVAIIGDYDASFAPHQATDAALQHAATQLGVGVEARWLATEPLEADLTEVDAADVLWCAPGTPTAAWPAHSLRCGTAANGASPRWARAGGCQHMVIEYARYALGFQDTQHAEHDPYASNLFACRQDHARHPHHWDPRRGLMRQRRGRGTVLLQLRSQPRAPEHAE
ncbi:hypothetical protein [Nocardia gipuzkoensis]